jgi:hypothetical protein
MIEALLNAHCLTLLTWADPESGGQRVPWQLSSLENRLSLPWPERELPAALRLKRDLGRTTAGVGKQRPRPFSPPARSP